MHAFRPSGRLAFPLHLGGPLTTYCHQLLMQLLVQSNSSTASARSCIERAAHLTSRRTPPSRSCTLTHAASSNQGSHICAIHLQADDLARRSERLRCRAGDASPSTAAASKRGKLWSASHATVHRCIKRMNLLPQGASILMAVSGGQDSLCMARLCLDLQHLHGWRLAVAHFDHRWRPDSAANAQYVQQLADQWSLPCFHATAHPGVRSEADARQWRYDTLHELAQQHGYSHVATGHTAGDVVETLLFNLFRGGGTDGMQALAWKRALGPGVTLVRPLLGLAREETADLCRLAGVQVWEDSTNEDLKYTRNRIRKQLLPYLRQHFNSRLDHSVAELAEIVRDEVACLDAQARQLLARALVRPAGEQQGEQQQGQQAQGRLVRQLDEQQQRQQASSSGAAQGGSGGGALLLSGQPGSSAAAAAESTAYSSPAAVQDEHGVEGLGMAGWPEAAEADGRQNQQQDMFVLPGCYQDAITTAGTSSTSTNTSASACTSTSASTWASAEDGDSLLQDLQLPPHECALDRRVLREAPVALQRRAVRLFLQASLRRGFNFSLVEQVVGLVRAPNRSQTDHLLQRTFACVDDDFIRLRSL